MILPRFISRTHFISWLYTRIVRRPSLRRAIGEGDVEVLGGFRDIPVPSGISDGFIVRVTSVNNKVWVIVITTKSEIYEINCIPWNNWTGKTDREGWNLYDGDDPNGNETLKHSCR